MSGLAELDVLQLQLGAVARQRSEDASVHVLLSSIDLDVEVGAGDHLALVAYGLELGHLGLVAGGENLRLELETSAAQCLEFKLANKAGFRLL